VSACAVEVTDRVISVRGPYVLKDRLKEAGGRWNPTAKAWQYPATAAAAERLRPFLGDRDPLPDAFRQLLADGAAAVAAQRFKDKGIDLDPLPFEPATQPWRHQLAAYHFAKDLPACLLYLGMGTGKSRIVLDLIQGQRHQVTLVVAPLSVLPAWQRQAQIHAPGVRVALLSDGSVQRRTSVAEREIAGARGPVILAVNYDAAWREPFASFALDLKPDLLVADECHRIKSAGSRVSMFFARLGVAAKRRLGLSGTPLAHSPLDAYGIFRFLDAGIFGTSFNRFAHQFAAFGGYENRQVIQYVNTDEFNRRFYSITFRADRDVLDLPDATHMERTFSLPAPAAKVYRELRDEFVAEVGEGLVTATNALSRLLRLQQLTSGHLPVGEGEERTVERLHTEKRRLLTEVLEEIEPGEPVVVFARFTQDLADVHKAAEAAGRTSSELSGHRRELEAWQSGATSVLAVQIQSGGEGVDLTRARYCVYFSLGYSLAQFEQSLARVHRPGQTKPVVYVHLIAEGTVDRAVYRALKGRKEVITNILEERDL
jgi:SNF2 family DNA or RNA helicase